jgi:uncharacterized protein involved in response to NO
MTGASGPAPGRRGPALDVLLEAGFRPFFLFGSLYAVLSLAAWLLVYAGVAQSPRAWPDPWPASYWHSHEMIFGFVTTAIAGFLLTAVPNWTDTPRLTGRHLAWLVAAWSFGRAALWLAPWLPAELVAAADLAFLPLLALAVGRPIWRAGMPRNYPVLGVLVLLAVANLGVHLGVYGPPSALARVSLHLALYLVLVLLAIISGRIVPLFTRNALRRRGIDARVESSVVVERLLVPVMGIAIGLVLLAEGSAASAVAGLSCGALLGVRQARWQPLRTLDQPILWVLHAGHAWLAVGFVCIGISALVASFLASTAMHAFAAGAIGTSVVGVMSRVALGHTGREIEAYPAIVVAYLLVILGGVVRVFGPLALPNEYRATVIGAGASWAAGYLIFALRAGGALIRPRVASGT